MSRKKSENYVCEECGKECENVWANNDFKLTFEELKWLCEECFNKENDHE